MIVKDKPAEAAPDAPKPELKGLYLHRPEYLMWFSNKRYEDFFVGVCRHESGWHLLTQRRHEDATMRSSGYSHDDPVFAGSRAECELLFNLIVRAYNTGVVDKAKTLAKELGVEVKYHHHVGGQIQPSYPKKD